MTSFEPSSIHGAVSEMDYERQQPISFVACFLKESDPIRVHPVWLHVCAFGSRTFTCIDEFHRTIEEIGSDLLQDRAKPQQR